MYRWTGHRQHTKGLRTCYLYVHPPHHCCCLFPSSFFVATLRELFAEVLRRQAGKQAHQQWGRGAVSLMSSKAVNTKIARRRCICSHVYQAEIHRASKPNTLHVLPNATEFNKDSELQRVKDKARESQIPEAKERPESYIMCRVRTLYPAVCGWICCSSKPWWSSCTKSVTGIFPTDASWRSSILLENNDVMECEGTSQSPFCFLLLHVSLFLPPFWFSVFYISLFFFLAGNCFYSSGISEIKPSSALWLIFL